MADDEKKKKKKIDAAGIGGFVAKVVKFFKYLANPFIFWIAVALLAIVLIVGLVGFIAGMPGSVLAWLTSLVTSIGTEENELAVTQEEIEDVCEYIESMGYDLESYGFVEEIRREEVTSEDGKTYENDTPSKGNIVPGSVKSKYIEAYIRAEKKSYVMYKETYTRLSEEDESEINSIYQDFINDYNAIGNVDRTMEGSSDDIKITSIIIIAYVFEEYWPAGSEIPEDLKIIINSMYEEKENAYQVKNNLGHAESQYVTIKKDELRDKIRILLQNYILENNVPEKDSPYEFATQLFENSGDGGDAFKRFNKIYSYLFSNLENVVKEGGLIVLENQNGEIQNEKEWSENKDVNGDGEEEQITYEATINKNNRWLIVGSSVQSGLWQRLLQIINLDEKYQYAYDLNGWTCKYGKPIEFLVALHLATQAPDFVYKIATEPQVDTKVHVRMFPIQSSFEFVIGENEEESINDIIKEAEEDAIQRMSGKYDWLKGWKDTLLAAEGWVFEIPSLVGASKDIEGYYNDLTNAYDSKDWISFIDAMKGIHLIVKWMDSTVGIIPTDPYCYLNGIRIYLEQYISEATVEIAGTSFDYETYKELKKVKSNFEGTETIASPYITKVEQHWYRNQYFTSEELDIAAIKTRLRSMILRIYNYYSEINLDEEINLDDTNENNGEIDILDYITDETVKTAIADIDTITTKEGAQTFVENQKTTWQGKVTDTEKWKKIENEIDAVRKQISNDDISGSAYEVKSNLEPIWYQVKEEANFNTDNQTIINFIRNLWVKETRNQDLVQLHNPIFEDNSQYIREWLKEKYYIYGTDPNKKTDNEGETKQILSNEKLAEGKQYINGKTSLQFIDKMLEECTDRDNLVYMLREVRELFQDFEFDLENTEVPEQKTLSNIMPAYKPYTPWPSTYEKSDINCTKMIHKTTESCSLVAPATGKIIKANNKTIEIEFKDTTNKRMVLRVEAEKGEFNVSESIINTEVQANTQIGTVTPGTVTTLTDNVETEGQMVILKLYLFNEAKQLLNVEDYMTVKSKNYSSAEADYSLTESEKKMLYSLIESEVEKTENISDDSQALAIVNVVFNRISSPYYPQNNSIQSVLNNSNEIGFLKYRYIDKTITQWEQNENAKYAIKNAVSGIDLTKTDTFIGATQYFATPIASTNEYYQGANIDEITEKHEELMVSVKKQNREFGITKQEYRAYLGDIMNKKLDEVIFVLNREHYNQGTTNDGNNEQGQEENYYLEFLKEFEEAKEEIIEYYERKDSDGQYTFLKECSATEQPIGAGIINHVAKSDIIVGEPDEEGWITDKFLITVNSNYVVRWSFTYQIGEGGKIISDTIEVEHQAIQNY